MSELVRRGNLLLRPDPRRVVATLFLPGQEMLTHGVSRAAAVIDRVLAMSDEDASDALADTTRLFADRHHELRAIFAAHFAQVAHYLPANAAPSAERRDLIGAYFTQEYAVEAAALFNPSIVIHPDQTGLETDELRFIMSVRAVGEGHISSIEFRTGVLAASGEVRIDNPGRHLVTGRATPETMPRESPGPYAGIDYRLHFPPERSLSERVISPTSADESHGVEDARFTRFVELDGAVTYYATYTAFDGSQVAPHLLRTDDFQTFDITRLAGPAAKNKGMALFPRRVAGQCLALSRWDRESIGIAGSVDARTWDGVGTVQIPERPWELIQVGNCGSPIETSKGWLVLTHGVGPMRAYGIGAILLDLDEPTKTIGALREPLLTPIGDERDGYVPNVVYSCGSLVHNQTLVLPYGCSDYSIRFAYVNLPELLDRLPF